MRARSRSSSSSWLRLEVKTKAVAVGLGIGAALLALYGLGFLFATIAVALAIVLDTWLALLAGHARPLRDRRESSGCCARPGSERRRDREGQWPQLAATDVRLRRSGGRSRWSARSSRPPWSSCATASATRPTSPASSAAGCPSSRPARSVQGFFLAGGIGATMRFLARKGRER